MVFSQNWEKLGTGLATHEIQCLYGDTFDNKLYVGGGITYINDSVFALNLAVWDGVKWDTLKNDLICTGCDIYSIFRFKNKLYVGGTLHDDSLTYPSPGNGIVFWEDEQWHPLQGGLRACTLQSGIMCAGTTYNMIEYNNSLLVVGFFALADTNNYIGIAQWDENKWFLDIPLVCGYYPTVIYSTALYNNELYVGGYFYNCPLKHIARWDGMQWQPLGNGINFCTNFGTYYRTSMVVYENELYVAGKFTKASGNAGNYIMKWDGQEWHDVGGGTDRVIYDMTVFNNELYVVGEFTTAGGVPPEKIAKWNGNQWCGLGSNILGRIRAVEVYNYELYIAGGFLLVDSDSILDIAKWTAGNYVDTCGVTGVNDEFNNMVNAIIIIHPNPSDDGHYSIEINDDFDLNSIKVYDIFGKTVKEISINSLNKENIIALDLSHHPAGVYLVHFISSSEYVVSKIIRL